MSAPQKQDGLRARRGHRPPRRPHRRPASRDRGPRARLRRRHGARHAGPGSALSLGARRRRPGAVPPARRGRGSGLGGAGSLADVTSCPGAEACRLAVTQSRGLGKLLGDHLRERPDLVAAVPGLDIKISGCPNGCGQHHIAGLGFQGSVRKVGDKAVPQYFVMLGGGVDGGPRSFGRIAAKVPARRIPEAVERLVALYTAEGGPGETARSFFRRLEIPRAKALLADLEELSPETADARRLHRPRRGRRSSWSRRRKGSAWPEPAASSTDRPPARLGACRRNPARARRRVQLRGGARRQPARRTFCTLSRLSRAPTKQMGPYHRSSPSACDPTDSARRRPG